MAQSIPIPVQQPSAVSSLVPEPSTISPPIQDRFDQMFGRMRSTMTILGDIVNPDPEMWTCERE